MTLLKFRTIIFHTIYVYLHYYNILEYKVYDREQKKINIQNLRLENVELPYNIIQTYNSVLLQKPYKPKQLTEIVLDFIARHASVINIFKYKINKDIIYHYIYVDTVIYYMNNCHVWLEKD